MQTVKVNDKSSKIAEKEAILGRSGVYIYSRDEVLAWGVKPLKDKPFYSEYRPAGVLVEAKDMFNMVPLTRGHPSADVDGVNFRSLVSGTTGGPIEVVALDDGEIGLKGKVAFFTQDAWDYYNAGNVETSAGFDKIVKQVKNADEVGYDFVLEKIVGLNHMAVVPKGRGGSTVRVMDNAAVIDKGIGGKRMKVISGVLERLGIVKAKDGNFTFSGVLLDSVAKVHSLDAAGLEKEIAGVMEHATALGDSDAKEVLVGMVTDCFKHPVEVIAAREKVAAKVDEIYTKCRDADAAAVNRILDAEASEEEEEDCSDEEDCKDGKTKEPAAAKDGKTKKPVAAKDAVPFDAAAVIDAAVQKAVVAVTDSIDSKIDAAVKKSLGLEEQGAAPPAPGSAAASLDGAAYTGDPSFLVRGCFGVR